MATASVENNMNELFNKVLHSLKIRGTKKEIQPYIEKMDTSFLLEPNPSIKDWGKGLPRYTEFFTMTFGEGHPQFNFLLELLVDDTKHRIQLNDRDIMHFVICGVFWRYYNSRSIINSAIEQFKESRYSDMKKIPFTDELGKLLCDTNVNREYSQFKRYGETL